MNIWKESIKQKSKGEEMHRMEKNSLKEIKREKVKEERKKEKKKKRMQI